MLHMLGDLPWLINKTPWKKKATSLIPWSTTSIWLCGRLKMASLQLTRTPLSLFRQERQQHPRKKNSTAFELKAPRPRLTLSVRSYKVVIEHDGESTEVEVEPDETILSKALDSGLSVPHDCKLGVCMTCPARLISGSVDQSDGMLSDDVVERGYALLCAAYPQSDCHIKIIPEEELLSLQLATANDWLLVCFWVLNLV